MTADRQLWWLYGPPCSGKSTTAWQLYAHLLDGPRAYVDVDQLGMCYPEPTEDPGRYRLKARATVAAARHFLAAGASTVIVSGVLDDSTFATLAAGLDGVSVRFCRLRVDPEVLRQRLEARYGEDDAARALAEAAAWEQEDEHAVVDADGHPVGVGRRVLDAFRAARAEQAVDLLIDPPPPPADPGRALLVCGPTGVGKSTIGFAAFMDLLAADRPSAYLDLQQLSFLAEVVVDRHDVAAACVGDLWPLFRAVGSRTLIMSGRIGGAGDVARYRRALGSTPLFVGCLRAGPAALRERIEARARGESPELAGDALVGLDRDGIASAWQEALLEQECLEQVEGAQVVIDVDDLEPGTAADQLISRLGPTTG